MEKAPFEFIESVIVRSPVYPYQSGAKIDDVYTLINDRFFLESIYIASPLLYDECLKLKDGQVKSNKEKEKIERSIYRYYIRMHTRSTPFGLFSTCGVGTWTDAETSTGYQEKSFRRHTRLDIHFLHKMTSNFIHTPEIKPYLKYYPNNSAYSIGTEVRYIEYTYVNNLRKYKISAITNNQYITRVLAISKGGLTISEIESEIVKGGVSFTDAKDFVSSVIDSQLLVSEFEVSLTHNDDYFLQIQKTLTNLYQQSQNEKIAAILQLLSDIHQEINDLDKNTANDISKYKSIIDRLRILEPALDESKTFHIDAYRIDNTHQVNNGVKDQLLDLMCFLKELNAGAVNLNEKFENFKNKFFQRYEYSAVPLADALDTDFGIGYPIDKATFSAPLVDDIPFDNDEFNTTVNLSFIDKWLLNILRDPQHKTAPFIRLDEQKLPFPGNNNWKFLPLSLSAMFRLVNDQEKTILFEGFFSPSAASVLARFTHGNNEIRKVTQEIVDKEELLADNCLLAEIAHMPDNRISNVIMHPTLRKYEIPYLAVAGVSNEHVIELKDLYLKMQNNEIILFSKRLNKRVIPCKTHMHNHFSNTLPMYHFLSDLQMQGTHKSLSFSWGSITPLFNYLPRVYYKNIVLTPASWNLPAQVFKIAEDMDATVAFANFHHVKKQYNLPDLVLYAEGDNELLVDLNDSHAVNIWLALIKNKSNILLKEFLWINESNGTQHINQYIASLVYQGPKENIQPAFDPYLSQDTQDNLIQRTFPLGSEWLYFKFYCGASSGDLVLTAMILPMIQQLSNLNLVKKWFFIKYVDPDFHIRLRIQLIDQEDFAKVIQMINTSVMQSKNSLLIQKFQPDTYVREIERYGSNSMELCESLFCIDSLITLQLLHIFKGDQNQIRKSLCGLKLVDHMLNLFNLPLKEKTDLISTYKKGYQMEFRANKKTNEKINAKYNAYKDIIMETMGESINPLYKNINTLLEHKSQLMKPIVEEILELHEQDRLNIDLPSLISSLLHMMLNRLITQKERIHELLLYEFLFKYYAMQANVSKIKTTTAAS